LKVIKTIPNTKQLSMDDLDYFQAGLYSFTIVAGHEVLVLSLNQRLTKVSFKVAEVQKSFYLFSKSENNKLQL
jgi:hypothetical protein